MEEWEAVDARRAAPTFFARPAWAKALARSNPAYTPAPIRCFFDDGSSCIVPLVRARAPLGMRSYLGTPFGCTIALRENGVEAEPEFGAAAIGHILARAGQSINVTPWPMAGHAAHDFGASRTEKTTSVVDLKDGVDAALARMDGKFRRMAGQADRRGVACAYDRSPEAVDAYYAILEESALRWGRAKPTFPKRLLEALVHFGKDDVEIWFATFEGQRIAGGVILYGSEESNFWSAAMLSDFSALRPSNALNVALIRAAAARGVRWYNLGSSEGLPGVARFKEGVGGETLGYRTWRRDTAIYRLYRRLRGTRARWV
jgi:hypothetical protein